MKLRIVRYTFFISFFLVSILAATVAQAQELAVPLVDSTFTDEVSTVSLSNKDAKKEHRLLDTYLFTDTTHRQTWVYAWKHNTYFNTASRAKVDTLINDEIPSFPFYKTDVGAAFIGTSGGAALSFDYFKRQESEKLLFFSPYSDYTVTRENLTFYNTKSPFTQLVYQTSGKKRIREANLRVLHTQNITPELNVGVRYHRYGTRGQLQNQSTENRMVTFFTNYAGKRYTAHAAYVYNGVENQENGGIRFLDEFTEAEADTRTVSVRLTDAGNKLRSNTYFLTQTYAIPISWFKKSDTLAAGAGTMLYLGHALQYDRQYRIYADKLDTTHFVDTIKKTLYFKNGFLDPVNSRDSVNLTTLDNRFFIRLQPWSPTAIVSSIDGGIGLFNSSYYMFTPDQFLHGEASPTRFNDFYVYAKAGGVFRKYFAWSGNTSYYLSGFRQGDMLLDFNTRVSFYPFTHRVDFSGRAKFSTTTPDYYQQTFFSNRFKWNNSFSKTKETRIELSLTIPDLDMEIGARHALINDFVYYDTTAMVQQYGDALNVTSIYLMKNFKLGVLHLDNRILFQQTSSEEVLPLPPISLNATWYLQHEVIKSVMVAQLGINAYWHSSYYIYAYNPAVGMFHTQNERKVGSFPFADLFLNVRWKRASVFVKYTNLAMGMFNNDYFSALHYPQSRRMFRFGVSWNFYN